MRLNKSVLKKQFKKRKILKRLTTSIKSNPKSIAQKLKFLLNSSKTGGASKCSISIGCRHVTMLLFSN